MKSFLSNIFGDFYLVTLVRCRHTRPLKIRNMHPCRQIFKWAIPALFFLYLRLFNSVEIKQMFNIIFANDWNRTVDLWYWKRPLYQLSHNHCPTALFCKNCVKIRETKRATEGRGGLFKKRKACSRQIKFGTKQTWKMAQNKFSTKLGQLKKKYLTRNHERKEFLESTFMYFLWSFSLSLSFLLRIADY